MTTITTNTAAAKISTGFDTLIVRLVALMSAVNSPEALPAAQSRREAAFAATNALLR